MYLCFIGTALEVAITGRRSHSRAHACMCSIEEQHPSNQQQASTLQVATGPIASACIQMIKYDLALNEAD